MSFYFAEIIYDMERYPWQSSSEGKLFRSKVETETTRAEIAHVRG